MISEWCKYDEALNFTVEVEAMERIMTAIKAIRNRRAEMNVPPSRKALLCVETAEKDVFSAASPVLMRLASGSSVEVGAEFKMPDAVRVVTDAATIYIPMNELVDFTAELARLKKELETANKDKEFFEKKLNNPGFVAKAPKELVETQKAQLSKTLDKISMLEDSIKSIEKQM